MLSILASYAQEESLSASENQKWRVRRNFEQGIPWRFFMLGYRGENGRLVVVPEEADIVRGIFRDYLDGKGTAANVKRLNEEGYATQSGCVFHKSAVDRILRNYAYTGNLLLQTKFRENYLTKITRKNQGELPQYHAANTHEAIIPAGNLSGCSGRDPAEEGEIRTYQATETLLVYRPYHLCHLRQTLSPQKHRHGTDLDLFHHTILTGKPTAPPKPSRKKS